VSEPDHSARDLLFKTAIALMSKKGYHGTSMSDLEKGSGLGRSSIYHYVRSKEALLAEICDASTRRQASIAKAIVDAEEPPRTQLFMLIEALVTEIVENRDRALVSLREFHFLKGDYRKSVVANRTEYEGHWRTVLQRCIDEKLIDGFSEFDLNATLGMVNFSAVWMHRAPQESPQRMAERFTALIMKGLS